MILRFSSIGDIILTTPVVRCIKKQIPDAEIHYCTKKAYISLLENNPYIDKIIPLEDSLKELIKELKSNDYDHVVDLHYNLRTLSIKSSLFFKTKIEAFDKLNIQKFLAVKLKAKNFLPNIHVVERYFTATKKLGIKNDNQGLDYFLPEDLTIEKLPENFQKNYITLVIGAQFQTKQFPVSKIIKLCQLLPNQKFVVVGGKEDIERGEQITQACPNVLNACGKYSFNGSAWLIKKSDLVLTNDTGMMHIAAAFNKKIISIWGNTIPEFGMYPYLPQNPENYSIHEIKNLSCRPCSKIGYKSCPKGHFKCMEEQNIEEIVQDIKAKLLA